MKKIIIALLLLLVTFANAQSSKIGVGIMPFTYASGASNSEDANSIQETVTNSFVKTKRFNIVDRSKMDLLKKEKELQKTEDFIDGTVIAQGNALGAEYLISGHVISAQATQMTTESGKSVYKAKLAISIKVIDVATGQVITSETIEPKAGNSLLGAIGIGSSSPQLAISKAIQDIQDKIDSFVMRNFPSTFSIVEIQAKDSKGAATQLLVAGGSDSGLEKGDKLKVVEILMMEVNGKKVQRKKEIGELKINKVEDENFSICSVKSGGIDINTKHESKANIQVIIALE